MHGVADKLKLLAILLLLFGIPIALSIFDDGNASYGDRYDYIRAPSN